MTTDSRNAKILSIVIPMFNEEGNVANILKEIHTATKQIPMALEIILVDDGSSDDTWKEIEKSINQYPYLKGLRLSRNFGHQHALLAGLNASSGDAVVTMDGDLQHPPELIPDLVKEWEKGTKIVNTKRLDKPVSSSFKRLTSKYFYLLFSSLSEVDVSEGSSDFRLIDRKPLDVLLSFQDSELFIRGAVQWIGFRSVTIPYNAAKRYSGETKYSLKKMINFASGAIISYSTKPLRMGIWLGFLGLGLAFIEFFYAIAQYMRGLTVPGWASMTGIMSFWFGTLFVLLGIMGAYMANIHSMLQRRPKFIIMERLGTHAHNSDHRIGYPI